MDDIDLETRFSAAVDELRPSPELGARVAHRVTQRERHRRVARASVSVIAGLVVVAMVGTVIAFSQSRGKKVVTDRPDLAYRWSTLPAPPIPGRRNAAAVWTGNEAIFWGGETPAPSTTTCTSTGKKASCSVGATVSVGPGAIRPVRADGAAYEPEKGTWRVLPDAPIGPRSEATAVWTGTEMIVWGGWRRDITMTGPNGWADGAAYNPATNRWRLVPDAPINRVAADAVWTGGEMIIVGGSSTGGAGAHDALGAAYDPVKNTWRVLPNWPAPSDFNGVATSAIWTGDQILLWVPSDELDPATNLHQPALFSYRPDTNQWSRQASPARLFKLVWDRAFIGFDNGRLVLVGSVLEGRTTDVEAIAYDPAADTWSKVVRRQNTEGRLLGWDGPGIVRAEGQLLVITAVTASVVEQSTSAWHPIPSPPFALDSAAVVATDDGTVYVWGANGQAKLAADG
jgi:hypothetical protein